MVKAWALQKTLPVFAPIRIRWTMTRFLTCWNAYAGNWKLRTRKNILAARLEMPAMPLLKSATPRAKISCRTWTGTWAPRVLYTNRFICDTASSIS